MKNLRAVFLSEWLSNPYKRLLAKQLELKEIDVEEYIWSFIFLPKIFKGGKPDILHLHTLHAFVVGRNWPTRFIKLCLFVSQILLLRILGCKTLWTVHEWSNKLQGNNRNISSMQAAVLGFFLHAIITHCDTTKNDISKAFRLEKTNKVHVIPHGNYIGCYENIITPTDARKFLGIPEENTVFLLFGNLYRYKGALEAIDAFQFLPQDRITLVIAGSPDEANLEDQINSKIEGFKNILFTSQRVPDDEVQIFMNAADCVLVPYQVFTTSGVAILAASFGKACIAPDAGFFKDLFDSSGSILYGSSDNPELSYAMKSVIEDKERLAKMGKHNFELAEKWNWAYVAEETIKVYRL